MKTNFITGAFLLIFFAVIPQNGLGAGDEYEPDNTLKNAKAILVHSNAEFAEPAYNRVQSHNFYHTGDEDWVCFYALEGEFYTVRVKEPGTKCNAVIGIYDRYGNLAIPEEVNDMFAGEQEDAVFQCESEGIYYARIRQSKNAEYGEDTDYQLVLFIPAQDEPGYLYGDINPSEVPRAEFKTMDNSGMAVKSGSLSYPGGNYGFPHPKGNFRLMVSAVGYEDYEKDIEVKEGGATRENIPLNAIGGQPPKYHSADYNPPDYDIGISELFRVQLLFNMISYHCDPNGEDGYAPGTGDQTCSPHDSDFNQNWQIDLGEFLRAIELWKSGGYRVEAGTIDGFSAGISGSRQSAVGKIKLRAESRKPRDGDDIPRASHCASQSACFPGAIITFNNRIEYAEVPISLGMAVNLPNGWSYVPEEDNPADDDPIVGLSDTGDIEILWKDIPASPAEFSYSVKISADEAAYSQQISARMLYRDSSGQEFVGAVQPDPLLLTIKFPGDINGDCEVNLSDAITALKVLSGKSGEGLLRPDYALSGVDITGDNIVGAEDVVEILRKIASDLRGLRNLEGL
jgi:hypothetical protein